MIIWSSGVCGGHDRPAQETSKVEVIMKYAAAVCGVMRHVEGIRVVVAGTGRQPRC